MKKVPASMDEDASRRMVQRGRTSMEGEGDQLEHSTPAKDRMERRKEDILTL
jgi:hypothetical protein